MGLIHKLPLHLVNKIAAGEVIERPASIVKELVENALDAGAARIDVAVEDGGRKGVAVTDNGCGMAEADLALAFAPHATSKITAEDDLYSIETMGFRGEALASIASISHAHIRTCPRAAEGEGVVASSGGFEIEASGETVGQVRPCACAPGTTISVRDLFFNTPARRKFLKAAGTELGHVSETLARLALPHPQVAFTLTHNGRGVLNLPAASSTLQRIADLFGPDVSEGLLAIAGRNGPVSVAGLIAPPSAARATAKWQYFFLNGRYIRDRLLGHALREAYRGLVDPNRSPAAFIFLKVPAADVDVNVHPTKIEVRFRDGQLVYGELLASLRSTLNRANLSAPVSLDSASQSAVASPDLPPPSPAAEDRRASIRQALADFFKSSSSPQPHLGFPAPQRPPVTTAPQMPHQGDMSAQPPAVSRPGPSHLADPAAPAGSGAATMQVHNAYIVAPCEDGLVIIDQHALHERMIYNDLRRRLSTGKLAGQRLLIPQPLGVTAAQADLLARFAELLATLGIEVAAFGPGTVAIQQFPSLLAGRGVAAAEFMRELLDKLAEDENTDSERLLADVLEMLACKAAVKAGQALTAVEIDALLARREECEKGSACPHGRPTTLKLTLRELEKQFKRT
ncbi:MAG: DNA mismatch repair endonuclease MutL [Phycisphaerae bacterium]|jgi:DNA mismatch repair protein MutL